MVTPMSILLSFKVSGLERDELKCTKTLFLNSCAVQHWSSTKKVKLRMLKGKNLIFSKKLEYITQDNIITRKNLQQVSKMKKEKVHS